MNILDVHSIDLYTSDHETPGYPIDGPDQQVGVTECSLVLTLQDGDAQFLIWPWINHRVPSNQLI